MINCEMTTPKTFKINLTETIKEIASKNNYSVEECIDRYDGVKERLTALGKVLNKIHTRIWCNEWFKNNKHTIDKKVIFEIKMFNLTGEDVYDYATYPNDNFRKRSDRFVLKLIILTMQGYRLKRHIISEYVKEFYDGNVLKFLGLLLVTLKGINIETRVNIHYIYIFCLYVKILSNNFQELNSTFKISDNLMEVSIEDVDKSVIFNKYRNDYIDTFYELPTYIYTAHDELDVQHKHIIKNEY